MSDVSCSGRRSQSTTSHNSIGLPTWADYPFPRMPITEAPERIAPFVGDFHVLFQKRWHSAPCSIFNFQKRWTRCGKNCVGRRNGKRRAGIKPERSRGDGAKPAMGGYPVGLGVNHGGPWWPIGRLSGLS